MRAKPARLALALCLCATPAFAHDFWIELSNYRPQPGELLSIGLRVGEKFAGDPVPRPADGIDAFFLQDAAGRRSTLSGPIGQEPAGLAVIDNSAAGLVAYSGGGSMVEMTPAAFDAYLDRYHIRPTNLAPSDATEPPVRERFWRDAKVLFGDSDPVGAVSKPVGLPLEITADPDPRATRGDIRGHVLWRSEPLSNVLVRADLDGKPELSLAARTDAAGAFRIRLPEPGLWSLRAVHIERAWFFADHDWDSRWSSLVFEWREPPP